MNMQRTTSSLVITAVFALTCVFGGNDYATQTSGFQIPGHGTFRLAVPSGWQTSDVPLDQPASVTIRIAPAKGDSFEVHISTVWLDAKALAATTPESRRRDVEHSAEEMLSHAVEKNATIQEIKGPESVGNYYSLTDRAPGEEEFKYVSQGTLLTGEVFSAFTILYRTESSAEVTRVLRMLTEAIYLK